MEDKTSAFPSEWLYASTQTILGAAGVLPEVT